MAGQGRAGLGLCNLQFNFEILHWVTFGSAKLSNNYSTGKISCSMHYIWAPSIDEPVFTATVAVHQCAFSTIWTCEVVGDVLIGKSVYVKHNLIKQCSILPRALVNTGGLETGPEEGHQVCHCQVGRHKVLQVLGDQSRTDGIVCDKTDESYRGAGGRVRDRLLLGVKLVIVWARTIGGRGEGAGSWHGGLRQRVDLWVGACRGVWGRAWSVLGLWGQQHPRHDDCPPAEPGQDHGDGRQDAEKCSPMDNIQACQWW